MQKSPIYTNPSAPRGEFGESAVVCDSTGFEALCRPSRENLKANTGRIVVPHLSLGPKETKADARACRGVVAQTVTPQCTMLELAEDFEPRSLGGPRLSDLVLSPCLLTPFLLRGASHKDILQPTTLLPKTPRPTPGGFWVTATWRCWEESGQTDPAGFPSVHLHRVAAFGSASFSLPQYKIPKKSCPQREKGHWGGFGGSQGPRDLVRVEAGHGGVITGSQAGSTLRTNPWRCSLPIAGHLSLAHHLPGPRPRHHNRIMSHL